MKNLFFENLNYLIVRDFWMVKIWPYFHKSIWVAIFVCFSIFCPKSILFLNFIWGIIPLDFLGFSFMTSKSKNDINYIKYQFSHRFGKVCKWLNMYYSNIIILIIFKVTTISIWIILRNLVWTYEECIFCHFWPLYCAFHPVTLYSIPSHKASLDS